MAGFLKQPHQSLVGLFIARHGCLTCHSDSYRAMRGCTVCAQQAVTRYKEADEGLVGLFGKASHEVRLYLQDGTLVEM